MYSNNIKRTTLSNHVNVKPSSLPSQEQMAKQNTLISKTKRQGFGCNDLGDQVQRLRELYPSFVHSPNQRNNTSSKSTALRLPECITLEKHRSLEALFNANIHVSSISLKMRSILLIRQIITIGLNSSQRISCEENTRRQNER